MQGINRKIMIALVLALAFTACEYDNEWSPYKSNATLRDTHITYQATTITGETFGDPSFTWTLKVLEGADFCKPVASAGFVGSTFSLNFSRNEADSERVAEVLIQFSDGFSKTFTVRQLVKTEYEGYDRPWAEQPEYKEGTSLVHKTYFTTTMNNEVVRNYSICYDTDNLVARWVAYPVHSMYMQRGTYKAKNNNGRTDAWAFDDAVCEYSESGGYRVVRYDYTDPIIPQSQQWQATSTYGGGYARGHILPSASRYNTFNTNAQTFYSTNIMPQAYDFNGGSWVTIEGKVRGWSCPDTLFVVTGTLLESTKTLSKNGRTVRVPSHCYKLVLRTKSGNTRKHISDITSADELKCIGFLYENDNSEENTTPAQAAVSVAEIESRSGFKFFRNLNPAIADKVKAQKNLSDWGL